MLTKCTSYNFSEKLKTLYGQRPNYVQDTLIAIVV